MIMEISAFNKSVPVSPRKIRLVADSIRNASAVDALNALVVMRKRGATVLEKLLKSAIANAVNNAKLQKETLKIESILVTDGPANKRFRPSTRGRVHPYKKRTSHIRITLKEAHGTKS